MGTGGRDDDAGSGGEAEEESAEAKIDGNRRAESITYWRAGGVGRVVPDQDGHQSPPDICCLKFLNVSARGCR